MKSILPALFAVALTLAFPAEAAASYAEVQLAPISQTYAAPSLGRRQGWLTIVNRDWKSYTVNIMQNGRMAITAGEVYGGTVVHSGQSVILAVEAETWEVYGSSGAMLKCKVREGGGSMISLEPYGYANNSGLRGVSNDGENVRSEILIHNYSQPVVIQRPSVVVECPVVVAHPPVHRPHVVMGRPHHRPNHDFHHRPQPSRRPQLRDDRDGGGRPPRRGR